MIEFGWKNNRVVYTRQGKGGEGNPKMQWSRNIGHTQQTDEIEQKLVEIIKNRT